MKERGKLFYLLIFLLIILFFYPIFEGKNLGGKLLAVFFTGILVTGVYAVSKNSLRKLVISLLLGVPAAVLLWMEQFIEGRTLDALSYAFMAAFTFFTVYCVLAYIMRAKKVTPDILAGAVCTYLLLGISWGLLYALLETIVPGSFAIKGGTGKAAISSWSVFNYYSFTTLTTLGYGDITPVSARGQSLALLEAVAGLLFMAILVARLVGMYTLHSQGRTEEN
ncbi:MAG: potassium channel family protein, partial [Candidatus Omnitrophota bacterium]